MRYLKLILILFTLTIFQSAVVAQEQYQFIDRGNRMEGKKPIGISAPDLELLSFVGSKENVAADMNLVLKSENVWLGFYNSNDLAVFDGTDKRTTYNPANSSMPECSRINDIILDDYNNKWLATEGLVWLF